METASKDKRAKRLEPSEEEGLSDIMSSWSLPGSFQAWKDSRDPVLYGPKIIIVWVAWTSFRLGSRR